MTLAVVAASLLAPRRKAALVHDTGVKASRSVIATATEASRLPRTHGHDQTCAELLSIIVRYSQFTDDSYWDAVGALTDAWSVGDVPADCRSLAKAVGGFIHEIDAWELRENPNAFYPPNSFWRSLEAVRKARQAGPDKPRAPSESIQELRGEQVSYA